MGDQVTEDVPEPQRATTVHFRIEANSSATADSARGSSTTSETLDEPDEKAQEIPNEPSPLSPPAQPCKLQITRGGSGAVSFSQQSYSRRRRRSTASYAALPPKQTTPNFSLGSAPYQATPPVEESTELGHTLFAKLGGRESLNMAVQLLYKRLTSDSELMPFFKGYSLPFLMRKQVLFMTYAFGGSNNYTGHDLMKAHVNMIRHKGLCVKHFDLLVAHFVEVMKELHVPQKTQSAAAAVLLSVRPLFDPAKYENFNEKESTSKIEASVSYSRPCCTIC